MNTSGFDYRPNSDGTQRVDQDILLIHAHNPDVWAEPFHTLFHTIAVILDNQADASLRSLDEREDTFLQVSMLHEGKELLVTLGFATIQGTNTFQLRVTQTLSYCSTPETDYTEEDRTKLETLPHPQ